MNDDDDYVYLKVIATMVGFALLPPTVVAVAMSFIAPGKAWLAVIAVLTGWFIGWRLGFAGILPTPMRVATATPRSPAIDHDYPHSRWLDAMRSYNPGRRAARSAAIHSQPACQ